MAPFSLIYGLFIIIFIYRGYRRRKIVNLLLNCAHSQPDDEQSSFFVHTGLWNQLTLWCFYISTESASVNYLINYTLAFSFLHQEYRTYFSCIISTLFFAYLHFSSFCFNDFHESTCTCWVRWLSCSNLVSSPLSPLLFLLFSQHPFFCLFLSFFFPSSHFRTHA